MDTAVIRGRLHEYIDRADSQHIAAMYVLLGKEIEPSHSYDNATLEMLYERVEKDLKGGIASYTAEETFDYIRSNKPQK
jgi:hypothetical protein